MIQAFLSGPQTIAFEERPTPEPGPTQVLIRIGATGICATDVHSFFGETIHGKVFPFHIGHEIAGTVERTGSKVRSLSVGDRVVVDPLVACGDCANCRSKHWNRCLNIRPIGLTGPGGFSEYTVIEERNAFRFTRRSDAEMTFAEPLSTVLHGLSTAGVKAGQRVLVQGAGTLGLLFAQALKNSVGCSDVSVGDIDAERLAVAAQYGAKTLAMPILKDSDSFKKAGGAFDVVIDCTGNRNAVAGAIPILADGGTFLIFGVCRHDDEISIRPFEVYRRELKIVGSFALNGNMAEAVGLLESGAVDVRGMIGGTVPPEQLEQTIRRLQAREASGRWIVSRAQAQGDGKQ